MRVLTEKEVGSAMVDYLSADGWDCYPEAQFRWGGRRADIAAVRFGKLLIVECKSRLTLTLLDQAAYWTMRAHFVAIATPRARSGTHAIVADFLRRNGIGQFVAERRGPAYESRPPRLHRSSHSQARELIEGLHPDMKRYRPGATAAEGFSTPWRRTMRQARQIITAQPGIGLKPLVDELNHHYASDQSAKSALRKWLEADQTIDVRRAGRRLAYFNDSAR